MLRNVGCLVLAFAAVVAGAPLLASAASPQTEAADKALSYVRTLQNPDGGFPMLSGSDSDPGATIDAVFAFVAAGTDPATEKKDGKSPLDYLESETDSYITTPGHLAKLVLGLAAAGEDPSDFAGHDLVAGMNAAFDGASHSYGDGPLDHALFMLAREEAGLSPATGAASHLESKQLDDGCWEWCDGWGCDTNTTALAIEALLAAGGDPSDNAIEDALDYLDDAQNKDGGWPYDPLSSWGTDSDANSTAFVIQALVAAGEEIDDWDRGGTTPLDALLLFQNPETGAFTYSGDDDAYATYQSIPALLLEPYPGAPKAVKRESRPTKTRTPTVTPTAEPTATTLPPSVAPTVVAPSTYAAPTSAVAGITVVAAGDGAAGEDSATTRLLATLLLAGGGALTVAGGVIVGVRRR